MQNLSAYLLLLAEEPPQRRFDPLLLLSGCDGSGSRHVAPHRNRVRLVVQALLAAVTRGQR